MPKAVQSYYQNFSDPQPYTAQTKLKDKSQGSQQIGIRFQYGEELLPPCVNIDALPPEAASRLNLEKLKNEGKHEYSDLKKLAKQYTDYGIEVIKHEIVDKNKLKRQRQIRAIETGGALIGTVVSGISLIFSGIKILFSSLTGGDTDAGYSSLKKSYFIFGGTGGLTGLAQDSKEWFAGALGMSAVSTFMDLKDPIALGLVSLFDGAQSMGMSDVRRRENETVSSVHKPFISHLPGLKWLSLYEQGVFSFFKNITNMDLIFKEEPARAFQAAGGGLGVAGGGLFGVGIISKVASFLGHEVPEKIKSLAYIPYALFSGANLVALFRDGNKVLKRANNYGSRLPGENTAMRVEGWFRRLAALVLGTSKAMLAIMPLGISEKVYDLARATEALGVSFASFGAGAQTSQNFIRTDKLGPEEEEILEYKIDKAKAIESAYAFIKEFENEHREATLSPKYQEVIDSLADEKLKVILQDLDATEIKKYQGTVTQAGILVPFNADRKDRYRYIRSLHERRDFTHLLRTQRFLYDYYSNKKNVDPDIKNLVESNTYSLPLAGEFHDDGHLRFSHGAEQILLDFKNFESSLDIVKDKDSEIHKILLKHLSIKEIEKICQTLGKLNADYTIVKIMGDYLEYCRTGEQSRTPGFPKWKLNKEVLWLTKQVRYFKDRSGKIKAGFTPAGAHAVAAMYYDLSVLHHNDTNKHPFVMAPQYILQYGLQKRGIKRSDLIKYTEPELLKMAYDAVKKSNGEEFTQEIRRTSGGQAKDGAKDPEKTIYMVNEDGSYYEYDEYLEKDPDNLKTNFSELYAGMTKRRAAHNTSKRYTTRCHAV